MMIQHHPPEEMLTAFAAGTLDSGQRIVIATHIAGCGRCRSFERAMQVVGGTVLERGPPDGMADDSFAKVMARLNRTAPAQPAAAPSDLDSIPGLPEFVRRRRFEGWKWISPGVHLRRMLPRKQSTTRVFLLKVAPATTMLQHSHTEMEMTCVLAGAFSHAGGHFRPGDFDLGDEQVDHRPVADPGEECICLVAMQGELRLSGVIGRLVQPFVRL